MDQHNQKSLLPDFSTNGFSGQFNGIPNGNSNSIISTLHTLHMQSIANPIIPQNDLHSDLQNQFLLEQIQLSAMQNFINEQMNGSQKLDPKFGQISQPNITIPSFTAITEPSTSNTIYSSIPSTSGLQNAVSHHTISATTLPSLALQNSLLLDNKLGANLNMKLPQTTIHQTQGAVEDWMTKICVDPLLDSLKNKTLQSTSIAPLNNQLTISNATLADNAFKLAASNFLLSSSIDTPIIASSIAQRIRDPSPEIQIVDLIEKSPMKTVVAEQTPSTSTPAESRTPATPVEKPANTSGLDYDEAHDDVDNIFGLSLAEDENRAGSLYRRPSSAGVGLSPIAFTPPDSPQHELTFDELFGLTSDKKDASASISKTEEISVDSPSTSADPSHPSTSKATAAKDEEDEFIANFVRPAKNVPVYKQKAALMSLEAREAAKKEDPNYDAFEFEDDDDIMFGGPSAEPKLFSDVPKKEEPKVKSVYITGVGFEIQGTVKDHTKRWQPKHHPAPPVHNDSFNDKVFFTIADKIRTKRDEELTCLFLKPEQSSSTECPKNIRRATPQEPLLPKFIIRINQLHTHCDEPVSARKRMKRRKNKSDNEDSDYDDVSFRRRKITRKVYSLHNESDPNFRRTVLEFPIGPGVSEADKKRVSAFGPAEGILPKGTYVVCKSDILREDCAVWRVDNQNLLQKFPQLRNPKTNKLVYKSSSTYSGWCEQISSQYFRVSVKIIKQTRSETTVEPEIPLAELFCASSIEWFRHPGTVFIKGEEIKTEPIAEEETNLAEPKRVALNTVLNACLSQVFTKKHVENLVEKKDFTYTRSVAEIEDKNKSCEDLIKRHIPVEMKHNKWIGTYTRIAVSKSSYYSLTKCQICKRKKPRRIIHFFDKTSYNMNIVVDDLVENIGDENWRDDCPVVADAIACGRCVSAVDFLHRMHHYHFHMLRSCEIKLEEIGTTDIDLSSDKIIEAAKADKGWVQSVIQGYCDLWEKIRYQFHDV